MSVNVERVMVSPAAPEVRVIEAVLIVALLSGPLVAVSPPVTIVGAVAVALVALVMSRPQAAAYVFLAVSPLVVGMERGSVVPLLRPNEALLLLLAAALLGRRILDPPETRPSLRSLHPVDVSILLLAVTASVVPLLWMVARGVDITQDDLLYASALWKYYAIYLLVRSSIRTEAQVARCLWISMAVAAVVGAIGILQALRVFGVPELLATYYAGGDVSGFDINRATSTIGQSQALGDVMIFNLVIAVAWLLHKGRPKALLVGAALFFALGTVASGQFSEVLGLVAGALALGLVTGRLRTAAALLVPVMAVALLALQPVVERRLSSVDTQTGLPTSWVGRWENLNTFFVPEVTKGTAVFGVRPAARVPAPEFLPGDWVYIESGHVWLLWTGGIPLFLAFFVFLWKGLRATAAVVRRRADAVGVAAIASFVSLVVLAAVTIFDPHLTMRGSADLFFPLLALALTGQRYRPRPVAQSRPTTS